MIHVVFNEADIEVLQKAIELDDVLHGDVYQIKDDFAVGPLAEIDTAEGWAERENWWRNLLDETGHNTDIVGSFDDRETVKKFFEILESDPEEELWIWMGQNQHDVCGYYWLMPQLKELQGRVMVLYLNNLPFINEKGQIFYPTNIHTIQPSEFLKAKKLSRAITLSEFEVDPDEWKRLCEENTMVRMLEGGKKIASKDVRFYDDEILKNITKEWQKGNRVLTNILNRMPIKTGDVFVMWRIKELITEEKIEALGDIRKAWKEVDLRLGGVKETMQTEEQQS
jgi:hypothetical protein